MRLYKTTEYNTISCYHYAKSEKEAINKHMIHYGLHDSSGIKVEEVINIDKSKICQDIYCNRKRVNI